MGTKRSFSEVEPSTDAGAHHGAKEHRHRDKKPQFKKLKRKEENINWVKKRARTIERLFQRDNAKLPANVQKDLERELAAHRQRIEDEKFRKRRSDMIGKYHMVRFFERKKAERMAKQLKKQIEQATDPEERVALKQDLHIAEVDSHYARYFPFLERYVSLYPIAKQAKESKTDEADDEADEKSLAKIALRAPRPPLWATVEKAMEEGQEALQNLRDRRTDVEAATKPQKKTFKETGRAARRQQERNKAASGGNSMKLGAKGKGAEIAAKREAAEEDGGGFFEEL